MSKHAENAEPEKTDKPSAKLVAPSLPYLPQDPKSYRPAIGLIGCGAITVEHLAAYRTAGYNVVALCDLDKEAAKQRQAEFFPDADVYTDHLELLRRDDIEIVDITTHPEVRAPLITAALEAGKHVLSQKPFVLDLVVGRRLVDLADKQQVQLAVNQNGRWAPHFSYMRHAVAAGYIGKPLAVHAAVHWDHGWVAGTPFEKIKHLILFDFAIHWFDMLTCVMGDAEPTRVFASTSRSASQTVKPDLMAQAQIEYDSALASLVFDGAVSHGAHDTTYVAGSLGTLRSEGPDHDHQKMTWCVGEQTASPELEGMWFPDGFHGTMGELMCAIEENREPTHSGRNNLRSLALCYAAVASAETGEPVKPGTVEKMPV